MDVIKAPTTIEHPIYRAEFKYTPAPGTKAKKDFSDTEIQERLTGNIMEVGEPERWNYKELCKRKGIELPVETEMLCDEFDFWLIQSAFAFMPAHDAQYDWGRIVAKMEPLSESMKKPITFDAYPRNIYQEKKEKHRISIGLNFKFAEIIEMKAERVQEIEFTRLEPIITVAGIGKSVPTWDFREGAAFNLKDVNALYFMVKMPIGSEGMKISYSWYAQIHTTWGGIIPTSARPKEGKETYEINF
jgi:hypothetical protein